MNPIIFVPQVDERGNEILGTLLHELSQALGRNERAPLYFVRIGKTVLIAEGSIKNHVLLIRDLACFHTQDLLNLRPYVQFFEELAHRCIVIRLASVNMTRSRRIEQTRMPVFARRSPLQVDLAGTVEKENVYRPVHQPLGVHFGASRLPYDVVVRIHNVKDLFVSVTHDVPTVTLSQPRSGTPDPAHCSSSILRGPTWQDINSAMPTSDYSRVVL